MIWKQLYGQTSHGHGILGYFKSLLNPAKILINPAVDFLLTVVTWHIIAVASEILGATKLDLHIPLPPDLSKLSSPQ